MKVVYNACFGGFGLSERGMRRYAEIKGIPLYPERDAHLSSLITYWTVPESQRPDMNRDWDAMSAEQRQQWNDQYRRSHLYDKDIERDDETLIRVVEELGDAASGECAKLAIRDIPSGARYRIDEYDGNESVVVVDEYDWKVAR